VSARHIAFVTAIGNLVAGTFSTPPSPLNLLIGVLVLGALALGVER
jgi:hypothetical protein